MPKEGPLRVEIVSHGSRDELLKGLISLAVVGAVIGAQWWATTPEAERQVKLGQLGLRRCAANSWHFRGLPLNWPPRRCDCWWIEPAPQPIQQAADQASRQREP